MSVVAYNRSFHDYDPESHVVLRDDSRGALVVYDRESKQLSIIKDYLSPEPLLPAPDLDFDPAAGLALTRTRTPTGSASDSAPPPAFTSAPALTSNSRTPRRGRTVCKHCGHVIDGDFSNRTTTNSVDPHPIVLDGSKFVSADYFKLLQSADSSASASTYNAASASASGISLSAFSQGYFDRFFTTKAFVGRGSRGSVYRVEHILDGVSLGDFALKKVPIGNNHEWLQKVLREVNLLRHLSHPNLVSYNHVWLEFSKVTEFGPDVPCAFILQEYCSGGTVEELVCGLLHPEDAEQSPQQLKAEFRRRRAASSATTNSLPANATATATATGIATSGSGRLLTFPEIRKIFRDIAEGVNELHRNQIVHRDLKPSNCLLMTPFGASTGVPTVLVSDFGEGQREGDLRAATGATGTLEYTAPETFHRVNGLLTQFTTKSDVFSLGMILHFLCFGKLPYRHLPTEFEELRAEIRRFEFVPDKTARPDLPAAVYELLARMLSRHAADRPATAHILAILEDFDRISTVSEAEAGSETGSEAHMTGHSSPENIFAETEKSSPEFEHWFPDSDPLFPESPQMYPNLEEDLRWLNAPAQIAYPAHPAGSARRTAVMWALAAVKVALVVSAVRNGGLARAGPVAEFVVPFAAGLEIRDSLIRKNVWLSCVAALALVVLAVSLQPGSGVAGGFWMRGSGAVGSWVRGSRRLGIQAAKS